MTMQRTLVESVYIQLVDELSSLECDLTRCDEIKSLVVLNRIAELRKQISELADVLQAN